MQETTIDIQTADGSMRTFITHPEQNGPFPAVILYMDVWGVREILFDLARRIATVGYCAVVPDFYYRQGQVLNEFRDEKGRTISIHYLDKEREEQARVPLRQLSDEMVLRDSEAVFTWLNNNPAAKPGSIGAVGYCMGGRHALYVATRHPERFRATASLHGTLLISDRSDSLHHKVRDLRGSVYCGFAAVDRTAPLTMVEAWNNLLEPCDIDYRYNLHPGTEHGYSIPDRDVFHKLAADRDWEMIFSMLHRELPPYADIQNQFKH